MSFYETQNYFINKLSLMFFQLALFFGGKREFVLFRLFVLFQLKKFKMKEKKIYIYTYSVEGTRIFNLHLKLFKFSLRVICH